MDSCISFLVVCGTNSHCMFLEILVFQNYGGILQIDRLVIGSAHTGKIYWSKLMKLRPLFV